MAKVLCVEDERDLREDIAEELEAAGHEVMQACDGIEALELIGNTPPDIVISDITMPRMNGNALLKAVRERHPSLANMPFIFLTALADQGDIVDGLAEGADDYLTKPIDFELLIGKVNAEARRRERIQTKAEQDYVKLYKALSAEANKHLKTGEDAQPRAAERKLTVHLVGSDVREMHIVQAVFENAGHEVKCFTRLSHFREALAHTTPHGLFLWPTLGGTSSKELIPDIPAEKCLTVLVAKPTDPSYRALNEAADMSLSFPIGEKVLLSRFLKAGIAKFGAGGSMH